ncbi:ethanolamine utilization protein EutN [Exilibacterium tricleocarpae]|uniref:Ethanolamine utilization protein EutN n=1 Tax=Exilibacterium tricleocarpae TaxID=2591008 RepID=A0A545TVD2_9GAMM|nr:EutN/CcmL family microcompartment protein [Exilibacterium tricleocarpae]TQV81121.1 ethanolamine utilization protein EutN [Exilibacterium tricleocarpae]
MKLAKVIGQVVATVRNDRLGMDKLVLVKFIDQTGAEDPAVAVAVDKLGAGEGEWVLLVAGSSARVAAGADAQTPVDLSVVGIVDEVTSERQSWFHKNGQS